MQTTINLGLKKPEANDTVNVDDLNYNADVLDQEVAARIKNAGGAPSVQAGLDAAKPAPGTAGRLYVATDTQIIYRDTGTAWQKVGIVKWNDIDGRPGSFIPSIHGNEAHDPDLALASDLAAHLAETVIKQNITINVPTDYPTVQAALDALKYAWIPRDVTVTIQVAAGTYTHTSPIIIDHPCGSRIRIIGATPITTSITGNGTVTGSAGNWSVPINVQSTAGINVGDWVIIKDTTGTGDHYAFRGIWQVTAVNSGTQLVVKNTHRKSTFPTATLSGGTLVKLPTVLTFSNSFGIVLVANRALGYLDNMALIGEGSSYNGIQVGRLLDDTQVSGPAFLRVGLLGVANFGTHGIRAAYGGVIAGTSTIASCGNGLHGIIADYGGVIYASGCIVNGNGQYGISADQKGAVNANYSTAAGNGWDGFFAGGGSFIEAIYSVSSGNIFNGFKSDGGSFVRCANCTANNNGDKGFAATGGGTMYAVSSTASGNTSSDYYAWLESSIYVNSYVGTPTFSPALNTVGNSNAIIST